MEKFAVDLDAVLDEFEYHEDQVRNATKYCHHSSESHHPQSVSRDQQQAFSKTMLHSAEAMQGTLPWGR